METLLNFCQTVSPIGVIALLIIVVMQLIKNIDKKSKAPEQEENKLETRVALVEQNIGYIKDSYKEIKESIDGINKKLENHVVHISAKIDDLWETMNNLKNK